MALRRTVVLSIEGLPLRLLRRLVADDALPRTAKILATGTLRPLAAGHPAEPICAWTTFATGVSPGAHNVFGFVDRRPVSWETQMASARRRTAEPLWDRLSRLSARVAVVNVPGTHPPRPVHGLLVAGFPAPSLEGASTDEPWEAELAAAGYRVDVDGRLVLGDRARLVEAVAQTLAAREAAVLALLGRERWDYLHVHASAIDRLHRAAWRSWEDDDAFGIAQLLPAYAQLDAFIGRCAERAGSDVDLVLLSDFGFAAIRGELQLNRWLEEVGLQTVAEPRDPRRFLRGLDVAWTRAYAIAPGRIYLNRHGRESGGIVRPGADAERVLGEIEDGLRNLRCPETAEPVIARVHRGADLFAGSAAHLAPDLVVEPQPGFVLRGTVAADALWQRTPLEGTHVEGDGFYFARGADERGRESRGDDDAAFTMLDAHRDVAGRLGIA